MGELGEELADLEGMSTHVAGFSDDGRGVQSRDMMRAAMCEAKRLDKVISAHCEDNSLLHGGCIHEGTYAREHGFVGISSESEWARSPVMWSLRRKPAANITSATFQLKRALK